MLPSTYIAATLIAGTLALSASIAARAERITSDPGGSIQSYITCLSG